MDYFGSCMRDCAGACSLITRVSEGRVVSVGGNAEHPLTRGYLCSKMRDVPGQHRDPDRLTKPLLRVGSKGTGSFRPIGWGPALNLVSDRLGDIVARRPGALLQYNSAGNMGILNYHFPERFFNVLGATGVVETICNTAGRRALEYVYGSCQGQDPQVIPHLDLLVTWGANPAWTNPHALPLIRLMRRRGGRHVVIDPVRTTTARLGQHLAIALGADYELAMGIIHLLIKQEAVDRDYVDGNTTGFDDLQRLASAYTPARVGASTGLGEAAVEGIAEALARSRRMLIHIGWGFQRRQGGGEAVRAICMIPALLGQGRKGLIYSNNKYGFDVAYLKGQELDGGRPRVNMMQVGHLLQKGHFDAMFVYNANPAASLANLGVVEEGLRRHDLFTVVHDLYLTDTALLADVVLPATHFLESEDIRASYYHRYLGYNARAVPPEGEAVSNRDLFRSLAQAMDLYAPGLTEDDESLMARTLGSNARIGSTDDLYHRGFLALEPVDLSAVATASGKVELRSWRAGEEGAGQLPQNPGPVPLFPGELHLLTPAHRDCLRSQDHKQPMHRVPSILINRQDAAARGIKEGLMVLARNSQGEARLIARVTDDVPSGVTVSYSCPWTQLAPGGTTINHLTPDAVQAHGGGAIFNSACITIEPAEPATPDT